MNNDKSILLSKKYNFSLLAMNEIPNLQSTIHPKQNIAEPLEKHLSSVMRK
ncbi:hypothetical protein ACJX0J_027635, partial [Zea mays]